VWHLRQTDPAGVAFLEQELGVPASLAAVLWLRGVRGPAAGRAWLHPSFSNLHDPGLLPDFEPAAKRITQAIRNREGILIWGHDDLDGIAATAVLKQVLEALRGRVKFYIPPKGRERHGLDAKRAIEECGTEARLIVTVDCGITNVEQVSLLKQAGIDVVVTDHHEVLDKLPDAVANVDPKRPDSKYPFRGLAGCGVALKLGMGLVRQMLGLSCPEFISAEPDTVGLAVLGTVADRVPLTGENRTLVASGLGLLERSHLAGLAAVMRRLRTGGPLTVGRMVGELIHLFAAGSGSEAVENLLGTDVARGEAWLAELGQRSQEWRKDAERSWQVALDSVQAGDGIVLVRNRDLSLRALGFCAGRLKDFYGLPAIVMGWRGDAWVGEGRSVADVDLLAILRAHSRYFIDYGGHKLAAGFTLADERADEFTRAVEQYAHEQIAGRLPDPNLVLVDARLPLPEFTTELRLLAPFGDGNPSPVFQSEPVLVKFSDRRLVSDTRPDLVLHAASPAFVPAGGRVELLYTIDESGTPLVLDSRPAETHA